MFLLPRALLRAAEEGTVQRVKVAGFSNDCSDGDPSSIYMYWDESAHLKHRPLNSRAVHYVRHVAQNEDIYGDVFLVCVHQNQLISLETDTIKKKAWFGDS